MLTYNIILYIFGIIDNPLLLLYEQSSEFVLREKGYKGPWRPGYFSSAQLSILKGLVGSLNYSISELYWISNIYLEDDYSYGIGEWHYDYENNMLIHQDQEVIVPEKLIALYHMMDGILLLTISGSLWRAKNTGNISFTLLSSYIPITRINDDIIFYFDGTIKQYNKGELHNINLSDRYYIIIVYFSIMGNRCQLGLSHTNEIHEFDEYYNVIKKLGNFPIFIDFYHWSDCIFFINEEGKFSFYNCNKKQYWCCDMLDRLGPWKRIVHSDLKIKLKGVNNNIQLIVNNWHETAMILEGEYS